MTGYAATDDDDCCSDLVIGSTIHTRLSHNRSQSVHARTHTRQGAILMRGCERNRFRFNDGDAGCIGEKDLPMAYACSKYPFVIYSLASSCDSARKAKRVPQTGE